MKHLGKPILVILLFSFVSTAGGITPDDINRAFVDAVKTARPSVVSILIYERITTNGKIRLKKVAHGSGTVIMKNGYIITNYHVVKKGNFYQALHDGRILDLEKLNGNYFLSDQKTDLALMKMKIPDAMPVKNARFGDSALLSPGEWVLAIGNPYGLNQSITSGIVSYKGRDNIGFTDIENFIQTDVPINPGNSGGPLINLKGELIGINTAIRTLSGGYQGISFAIPSNTVWKVATDLIKYGRVRRGWLGFLVRERQSPDKNDVYSIEVVTVLRNSPAEIAGLQTGDIITSVNGRRIKRLGELVSSVGIMDIGSRVSISILRSGNRRFYSFILREKGDYITMQNILDELFRTYGLEIDENSVNNELIVTYVSPKTIGAGIRRGDTVITLNGKKVLTLDDFTRVYKNSGSRIFSIDIERDSRIITVEFEKK